MAVRGTTPGWPAVMTAVAALLAGSGCRILAELIESDTAAEDTDAAPGTPDAEPGAPDARIGPDADLACESWSFTPTHIDPCAVPAPTGVLTLSPGVWTYDTNSGALTDPDQNASFPASALVTQSGGPEIRVLVVDSLEVQTGAELQAYGARPLVVVSYSDIAVDGLITVASTAARVGAGADPAECGATAPTAGTDYVDGAGGGGGGGFAEDGGGGGIGRDGAAAGGMAGTSVAVPSVVRGGCSGASGGNGSAMAGGAGGGGGGGLQLTARTSITINGVLHAGGGGGRASAGSRSGGGGGGSGGLIDLESVSITAGASAVIAANGGGGGGGSDGSPATDGQDAQASATAATGGFGQGMGKDGGDGGALGQVAANGVDASRGAGGGGGGVGYIVLRGSSLDVGDATVSPAADQP